MPETTLEPIDIPVLGMTCASCVGRVEKAIKAVPGVASAAVNLAAERAHVELADPGRTPAVIEAIRKVGYEPLERSIELKVGAYVAERKAQKRKAFLDGPHFELPANRYPK